MTSISTFLSMRRREFLKLGTAAAATFATRNLFAAAALSGDEALPTQLAIAFAGGAIDLDHNHDKAGVSLLAAPAMPVGDPRFLSHVAKVTVLGLWRPKDRRDVPITVAMNAYYPTTLFAGGDIAVCAWSYTSGNGRPRPRQSTFSIPIDDAGLRLEIESFVPINPSSIVQSIRRRVITTPSGTLFDPKDRAALASAPNVASLSLGVERDHAKLNRGLYVIALLPANAPAPDWQSIRFSPWDLKSNDGPVAVNGVLGDTPVPFDYLVLEVDYK